MRKLLINLVMLILAFTIQICVFPQIAFLSSAPNLLLIVVFVCSFIEGRERGMFYGLVAGLFMDLFYTVFHQSGVCQWNLQQVLL